MEKTIDVEKIEKTSINESATQMFLKLDATERRLLKRSYRDFKPVFSLNPYARSYFQKNNFDYILFIDARINSCYIRIKDYLDKNKHRISACYCVGDADFIVEYSATELLHERIKKDIFNLMYKLPQEDDEQLVQAYKVIKVIRLKRTDVNFRRSQDYVLSLDEIAKVSSMQRDYSSSQVHKSFRSDQDIKDFLAEMRERQILLGYYSMGTPEFPVIRAYILLLFCRGAYDIFILRNLKLKEKIIDFSGIDIESGDPQFYGHANYLITAEFSNIDEYHEWKDYLYLESSKNEHQVNVQTFIVENLISEIPLGIDDYILFDDIAKGYNPSGNNKFFLGYPIFYRETKTEYKICMSTATLKENGLIIGEPGTGKTYTAMILANKLVRKGKRVHIIDCTGGIASKFNEVYPNSSNVSITRINTDNIKPANIFHSSGSGIFFYQPAACKYSDVAKMFLNTILSMPNPDENRVTTDVVIFEEAHLLFDDEETNIAVRNCITICGRKGFGLWFSTQHLSSFPLALLPNLRNKIIHRVSHAEKDVVAHLLLENDGENIFGNLSDELANLSSGQAIISLVFPDGSRDVDRSPLKIQVINGDN